MKAGSGAKRKGKAMIKEYVNYVIMFYNYLYGPMGLSLTCPPAEVIIRTFLREGTDEA